MTKSYGDGTRLCSKCFNIKCKCSGNFSPSQLIASTDIDNAYDTQHAELTQLRTDLKAQEKVLTAAREARDSFHGRSGSQHLHMLNVFHLLDDVLTKFDKGRKTCRKTI